MSRLTVTWSEARYKALKEAAVQRDKTIGKLIHASLDFYGIKSREDARDLVRRARAHSKLPGTQALAVAIENVRSVRREGHVGVEADLRYLSLGFSAAAPHTVITKNTSAASKFSAAK